MKKIIPIFLGILLLCVSCKKDTVDATNLKTFQESINDMSSGLSTIEQIKFNEALYILKTFGVEADGDVYEMRALSKMVNGKKVPEILSMADQVAQKNGISWSSTAPPSMGEMDIFGNQKASTKDPNDIDANALTIITKPVSVDSVLGAKALQIIPKLIDSKGNPVTFEGAMLETNLQVFSNGTRLLTAKNLMQNNNFSGFNLKYASLPVDKIYDNAIDITVTVKTKEKTFKMSKIGLEVNSKALKPIVVNETKEENTTENSVSDDVKTNSNTEAAPKLADPKNTVQKFLNHLSTQNLKAAYETADNPNWGSYDNFANPNSGFGSVKNLNVKSLSTASAGDNAASVNATYEVTDNNGNASTVRATFGLKNINGNWKISNYKINK